MPMISRIYPIPFLALLTARAINFSGTINIDTIEDTPAKTGLTVFAYLLAGVLLIRRPALMPVSVQKFSLYFLYLAVSLVTLVWTVYPGAAALRFIHMIGTFLVCVCGAEWCLANGNAFIPAVSLAYCLFSCLSLTAVLLFPERGLIHAEWTSGNAFETRWVGVTGHPNILGASSYMAIWSAAACLYLPTSRSVKAASLISILVSLVLLIGSDSRTAQLATFTSILLLWLFQRVRLNSIFAHGDILQLVKTPRVLGLFLGTILMTCLILAFPGIAEVAARDGSAEILTGRAEIWRAGLDAIAEFPFGWGQDQLMTYWHSHKAYEEFPHFHDGFLDITVRSGVFGGIAMVLFLGLVAVWLYRLEVVNTKIAGPMMAFYLSFLEYNLTETSLDRETVLWPIVLLLALYAAIVSSNRLTRPLEFRFGRA